ncbi:MAG: leucine-rich repeat domain-containing protein [Bacteroidales bacterium]|nr:leucine-rich repeat domain-containing protein [Bacteroidales bacterium]
MDKDDLLVLIENAYVGNKTKLDLSNRDISEIPEEIGKLQNLKILNLSYNTIKKLPPSIGKLHNLEVLMLHKCFRGEFTRFIV